MPPMKNNLTAVYERNVVYRSVLTDRFYFAPKVKVIGEKTRLIIGRKYDVTDSLQPFLLKRFRKADQ